MNYLNFGPMLMYRVFILIFYIDAVILAVMPSFDRPSENLTVIIGNAALLPCFINNLGDHKVIYLILINLKTFELFLDYLMWDLDEISFTFPCLII